MADVQGATLRRAHLMQMLDSPWFEEFVTGSYVRVAAPPLPGKTEGGYLVCEVIGAFLPPPCPPAPPAQGAQGSADPPPPFAPLLQQA